MTFLEAKKIVEMGGYHIVKNTANETFRERVNRETLEEAKRIARRAGYKIVNENELTNFAYFDANGDIGAYKDYDDEIATASAVFHDNTDDPDMTPYDAELNILFKNEPENIDDIENALYEKLCKELLPFGYVDAMDDSYNNGETVALKFNFFFNKNDDSNTIINKMITIAKSFTDGNIKESRHATGRLINEFTGLSYEDYRDIVKDHLVRLGLDRATAAKYIMSYAESIEDNYNNEIDAVDTAQEIFDSSMDESCCGGKKKKSKKKGKKSTFIPFWARKKDKLNEDFGDTDGTTFSNICKKYITDSYFVTVVAKKGLKGAIEEVLAEMQDAIGHGIGDKYFKTFSARLRQSKTAMDAMFKLTNAMMAGENLDLSAGTKQSAFHRNRH